MKRQQLIIRPSENSRFRQQPRVEFWLQQSSRQPSHIKLNKSLLLKSQNVSQIYKYVKYDLQGNTQLVDQLKELQQGFSYQKVHLQQNDHHFLGQDINWSKDIQKLTSAINTKQRIVMRSIRKLWQQNYRPNFFDWIDQTKGIPFQYHTQRIPQCLYELDHLSPSHSKFLFLTQDFSNAGIYQVILNQDGRHRLVTVNDMVPVYNESNQHIWGIQEPWKMILIKVWACLNEGYDNILKSHQPFKFLEYFTGNNWKYYNLQREGSKWINHFKDLLDISYIVLQTKSSQNIQKMGLTPNSTAYNIISIRSDSERGVQIEVKSRFKHKWKGKLSMINYSKKLLKEEGKEFRLEKNFILTQEEFFEAFCCAYITSLSKSRSHVTDYTQIRIPKNNKNAIYMKFSIKNEGFLDFSFIQSYKNKISLQSQGSKIDAQKYNQQTGKSVPKSRFLKCKYMLIRSLKGSTKPLESKLSRLRSRNQLSLTKKSRYEAYEVEYLKGYNKGEAHFIMMQPGDYYFRLKSQTVNHDAVYYLNYCCSEKLEIQEEIILEQQRQDLFQSCILSLLPAASQVKLRPFTVYQGNKFDDMGYGFVVIQNKTHRLKNPKSIFFGIDTVSLQLQGYKLKGKKYLTLNKSNIILQIQPQTYLVLILKKISDDPTLHHVWPSKSIKLYDPNKSQQ